MRVLGLRWPYVVLLVLVLVIQAASGLFFVFSLVADVFLIRVPFIPWEAYEILQILASLGLLCGVLCSIIMLALTVRRSRRIEDQISAVAGEFQSHVERQFQAWGLTPSERSVALLVVKGFSNGEIAGMRNSSESTIKSHVTSIFRKSGLTSRQQLVSGVIEDLLAALSQDET